MDLSGATYLIYAEGAFGVHSSKLATSAIRYLPDRVAGVIDSEHAGRSVDAVLGFGGDIQIFSSVEEGLERSRIRPTALLIGIAPRGDVSRRTRFRSSSVPRLSVWTSSRGSTSSCRTSRRSRRRLRRRPPRSTIYVVLPRIFRSRSVLLGMWSRSRS